MAQITLINTSESDITLSAIGLNKELVQVVIPGARQDPDDREKKLIFGRAQVEEEVVEAARKKAVVRYYFETGFLRVETSPVDASPAGKKPQK